MVPVGPEHRVRVGWLPPTVLRHQALHDEASVRHGVDANLLAIVTLVESGGDPRAVSPAGARGLMQVMPATGGDIARQRKIADFAEEHLFDPVTNVDFGAWYLAAQIRRFWDADPQRTVELAAAAYNGGPGRLGRHLKGEAELSGETRRYMRWVGGMWYERFAPQSPTFAAWLEAGGKRLVDRAGGGDVIG